MTSNKYNPFPFTAMLLCLGVAIGAGFMLLTDKLAESEPELPAQPRDVPDTTTVCDRVIVMEWWNGDKTVTFKAPEK